MRFIVTRPVEGGTEYYRVVDTQSPIMPNFTVVEISMHYTDADYFAIKIAFNLNDSIRPCKWDSRGTHQNEV